MPIQLARYRLQNMLRMTAHLGRNFPVVPESPLRGPNVVIDPATGLVTVEVEIFIDRPIDEVAKAIDPPHWDDGSRFFYPDGALIVSPEQAQCLVDGKGRTCCIVTPIAQPLAGSDYDWSILYEHFHAVDETGHDTTFTNLLWVNPDWILTPEGERMYVVAYTLFAALDGRVGDVAGVKVIRDDGELSAKALRGGRARLRMRKHIRFESQWANVATYLGYRAARDELDDQFRETASASVRRATSPAN